MKIYGLDFTSRPRRDKPITCLEMEFLADTLAFKKLYELITFEKLEELLHSSGPWVMGMDFPFGLPRKFIENIGWPKSWRAYVDHVSTLTRDEFRAALNEYRHNRAVGDKEHRRATDVSARSISPQKLYGVPVGLMFYEGAPRIRRSGSTIPLLQTGDPERIILEAYPGVLARDLIGRRAYKHDDKKKQTPEKAEARAEIVARIKNFGLPDSFGFRVEAPEYLQEDPSGDQLDALLCAIQAAWAWKSKEQNYGAPKVVDELEGWIAHPFTD